MNTTIFVQQTGNIQSVHPQNRPSPQGKAAIVRPIKTASGEQVLTRIDARHEQTAGKPYSRSVQLADYVAQIHERQKKATAQNEAPQNQPQSQRAPVQETEIEIPPRFAPRAFGAEARSESTKTQQEVQAILDRIDRAHDEIARSNYLAAITPSMVASAVPNTKVETKQVVCPPLPASSIEPSVSAVSESVETELSNDEHQEAVAKLTSLEKEELLATISSAIVSVLSEIPVERLEEKLSSEIDKLPEQSTQNNLAPLDEIPTAFPVEANELRLQPEEPRPPVLTPVLTPHLSFPVSPLAPPVEDKSATQTSTAHSPAAQAGTAAKAVAIDENPNEVSSSIAAWDVNSFRWPAVTEQILTHGSAAIDELSNYCFDILAPFGGTIAVTSPTRGQGSTTLAMSLCRWATAKGKRVLLVDADLENPSLSREVGLAPNLSWVNAVRNAQPACEAIIRSQDTQTCIMPQAPIVSRVVLPPNLFDSLAFLIAEVKSEFDLIVLDMGPCEQIVQELSRANDLIDAVLLVDKDLQSTSFLRAKESLIDLGIQKFVAAQNSARTAAA